MKKFLSLALCCAVAVACFTGCTAKEKLNFTNEVNTIKVGETLQLEMNKEGAAFAVSNEAVISVDGSGLVTAIAEGEAEVTATLKKETVNFAITVVKAEEAEEEVSDESTLPDEEVDEKEDVVSGEDTQGAGAENSESESKEPVKEEKPAETPKPTEKPVEPTKTPEPTPTPTAKPVETPKPTEKPAETPAPHTHAWGNATCTQPQKCSCGATQGGALGHAWKDATYEAPKTCTRCGATEGSAIPKPVCGAVGHSAEGTCGVCGQSYTKPVETRKCDICQSTAHTTEKHNNTTGRTPCPVCGSDSHDICSSNATPVPGASQGDRDWA